MWKLLSLLFLAYFPLSLSAQSPSLDTTYRREWLDIDSTIKATRLPKTALEKVIRLYQMSARDNPGPQQLKCIILEELYEKVLAAPENIKVSGTANDAVAYAAQKEDDAELSEKTNLPSAQRLYITPVRKQLQETAFFLPKVFADSSDNYTIHFTLPESLTRWKWMIFAHSQSLQTGFREIEVEARKQLMVIPQMPRFLREGDQIELITQIANLGDSELTGQVALELINAATDTPVDGWFNNVFLVQYFTAAAGKTSIIRFPIQVPYGFNQPLIWRIKAQSGKLSDGEQNILPVTTNRTLVTESRSFWLQGDTTQT
ncbi:MAG: alpha-2-macroglobulin family protein, partial [Sediminibacterium sp.]